MYKQSLYPSDQLKNMYYINISRSTMTQQQETRKDITVSSCMD